MEFKKFACLLFLVLATAASARPSEEAAETLPEAAPEAAPAAGENGSLLPEMPTMDNLVSNWKGKGTGSEVFTPEFEIQYIFF